MKKILLAIGAIVIVLTVNAQNYNVTVNSQFQPMSVEEHLRYMQAQAARDAYLEKRYDEYTGYAYKALKRGNRYDFIYYSNIALETGLYSSQLYYDRGAAFEYLKDYKRAKKEYKKAYKHGYYEAYYALEKLKKLRKR